jgi:hypothetical protein
MQSIVDESKLEEEKALQMFNEGEAALKNDDAASESPL